MAIAGVAHRRFRARAFPKATLVVSTPGLAVASTCRITPQVDSLAPGLTFTMTANKMRFKDEEHELKASWSYLGGAFGGDVYRITTSFDGSPEAATFWLSGIPVVVIARDGYQLALHPDDSVVPGK